MKFPNLPQITYAFGILGFLYSVIVRRKRVSFKEELATHLEATLAGLAIPSSAYLVACGFYPELLVRIPGYQYYAGAFGMAALFFAVHKLVFAIPLKKDDSSK